MEDMPRPDADGGDVGGADAAFAMTLKARAQAAGGGQSAAASSSSANGAAAGAGAGAGAGADGGGGAAARPSRRRSGAFRMEEASTNAMPWLQRGSEDGAAGPAHSAALQSAHCVRYPAST